MIVFLIRSNQPQLRPHVILNQGILTYKSGAVIIPDSLGIAKSLQDGIGLHHLVLKGDFASCGFASGANRGKVTNDLLCVLSFTSTRLTTVLGKKNM